MMEACGPSNKHGPQVVFLAVEAIAAPDQVLPTELPGDGIGMTLIGSLCAQVPQLGDHL